jgi:hypothetical protein
MLGPGPGNRGDTEDSGRMARGRKNKTYQSLPALVLPLGGTRKQDAVSTRRDERDLQIDTQKGGPRADKSTALSGRGTTGEDEGEEREKKQTRLLSEDEVGLYRCPSQTPSSSW